MPVGRRSRVWKSNRSTDSEGVPSRRVRELRIGRDDGSGAVFIADPTVPIDSDLGVELLAVNACLMELWRSSAGLTYGLPVAHHEHEFDVLAERQRALVRAIRAGAEDDR